MRSTSTFHRAPAGLRQELGESASHLQQETLLLESTQSELAATQSELEYFRDSLALKEARIAGELRQAALALGATSLSALEEGGPSAGSTARRNYMAGLAPRFPGRTRASSPCQPALPTCSQS